MLEGSSTKMNINEEDFTVASLAKLVGSELHVIDTFTENGAKGTANKLDPRSFLNKNFPQRPQNKNVIKHDGMTFYAGVDESLVQSMHPDVVPSVPQPEAVPPAALPYARPQQTATSQVGSVTSNEQNEALIKILQSIDKSLKSIDKTEKTLTKLVTHLTKNYSDQNTSQ